MEQDRSKQTSWPRFDERRRGPDRLHPRRSGHWLSAPRRRGLECRARGGHARGAHRIRRRASAGTASATSLQELSAAAGLDMRFTQRYDKPPLLAMVHETSPPQYFLHRRRQRRSGVRPRAVAVRAGCKRRSGYTSAASAWRAIRCVPNCSACCDQVKAAGKRVSYDPNFRNIMTAAYDPTLRHIAARADVIKVSDEDLLGLFRTERSGGRIRTAARHQPDRSHPPHAGRRWRRIAPAGKHADSTAAEASRWSTP